MEAIKHKNQFYKEKEIVLTEFPELFIVGKETRVVEEIRITKNVTTHDEAIHTSIKVRSRYRKIKIPYLTGL